jgi:DNA-binding response OmpR family regulator
MRSWHLLSVGYDPILMRSRSLVLRDAGFRVDEAYNVRGALDLVTSDSVDALVICHTLCKDDQRRLISGAREARRLLPIVCITTQGHELPEQGCVSVESDPVELVKSVRQALGDGS